MVMLNQTPDICYKHKTFFFPDCSLDSRKYESHQPGSGKWNIKGVGGLGMVLQVSLVQYNVFWMIQFVNTSHQNE